MQFLAERHNDILILANSFRTHITGINIGNINHYLSQFDHNDMAAAIKMLQKVDFYGGPRVIALARNLKKMIKERNNGTLQGILLCPMTTRSGDSANSMESLLKNIMAEDPAEEKKMINQSSMLRSIFDLHKLADDVDPKTIVLLDRFIGTGSSIINTWGHMQQWQNDNHRYIVVTLVAYEDAMEKIKEETDSVLDVLSGITLPSSARAFHKDNNNFSTVETNTIKKYCRKIEHNRKHWYGHNNSQSLVIFFDRSPNNALPVLHKTESQIWIPLFPRYF